jgi:hypothetical protein
MSDRGYIGTNRTDAHWIRWFLHFYRRIRICSRSTSCECIKTGGLDAKSCICTENHDCTRLLSVHLCWPMSRTMQTVKLHLLEGWAGKGRMAVRVAHERRPPLNNRCRPSRSPSTAQLLSTQRSHRPSCRPSQQPTSTHSYDAAPAKCPDPLTISRNRSVF